MDLKKTKLLQQQQHQPKKPNQQETHIRENRTNTDPWQQHISA